jgi:FAD/FMN-containing dehydrogenase
MASSLKKDFDPLSVIQSAVSSDALITDNRDCDYHAQDIFTTGPRPLAVFQPASVSELAEGIKAATGQNIAIIPRGGGMSYTSGFVADTAGCLLLDMGRMQTIIEINTVNMTVTVEAGCTWAKLYDALKPLGLRTPLWGSLSGLRATIGGGMSQNGVFWGARNGAMAQSALSYTIVLANGRIVETGHDVLRSFGPDLTGLFGADAGSLGVKAHITLPLVYEAEAFAYGSFVFDTPAQYCMAMSEIGRRGLASEAFGFDPFLQAQRMKRDSITADAKQLVGMMKAQGGFWKAVKEGAKVVAAGRSFLDDAKFSIHLICEGRNQAAVDHDLRQIEDIVAQAGGRSVENTIPKMARANPFPPLNSMLGPEGERWVPVHGIVNHDKALETIIEITAIFERHEADMERLGIGAGYMFLVIGTTGFLIEPVFYWPGPHEDIHRRSVEASHLSKLKDFGDHPEARAMVEHLRDEVIRIFGRMDGIHFQIGRTYPLKERSDPAAWSILEAVKTHVDPKGLMNPGALGL